MFDFIEQPMNSDKDAKEEVAPQLEGTVYTMPAHRKNMVASPSPMPMSSSGTISPAPKKSNGLIFVLVGVLIVIVVGTAGVIWWVSFRPSGPTTNQQASSSQDTTQTPTQTQTETPTTPTNETPTTTPATPQTPDTTIPTTSTTDTTSLSYVKAVDTDGDDLTDSEERLFGTDPQKPDTDGDNFLDGAEVKFLYDPTRPNPAKLDTSSTATLYSNPTYKYAMLYPSAWVVDSIDKANKEVMFSSATGEFISMTVQDNPEKLSALDWYSTVHQPNADTSKLQTMSYDTWTGVMSPDGLEVYMTAKDDSGAVITPYVYVLKYDLGGKKEMNFGAVFQMMIRSFLITDLSFTHK